VENAVRVQIVKDVEAKNENDTNFIAGVCIAS
jgi:hypothetical protein